MKSELPGILSLWKPVTVTVGDWVAAAASFCRVSVVRRRGVPAAEASGHAIWGTFIGPTPMALCWEWSLSHPGVVVLSNPMGVMSNVALVDPQGERFSHAQTLLELNRALYALDWQEQVLTDLRQGSAGLAPGRPARRAKAATGLHGPHGLQARLAA